MTVPELRSNWHMEIPQCRAEDSDHVLITEFSSWRVRSVDENGPGLVMLPGHSCLHAQEYEE